MSDLYPMAIEPRFDERIWGGDTLATRLGKAAPRDKPIGESWEIYEENTRAQRLLRRPDHRRAPRRRWAVA